MPADAHLETAASASRRPWYVVGAPWNNGAPYILARAEDPHAGSFVCDLDCPADDAYRDGDAKADAKLIVEAVNQHEALLDLAKASQRLSLELAQFLGLHDDESALIIRLRARAVEHHEALTKWEARHRV